MTVKINCLPLCVSSQPSTTVMCCITHIARASCSFPTCRHSKPLVCSKTRVWHGVAPLSQSAGQQLSRRLQLPTTAARTTLQQQGSKQPHQRSSVVALASVKDVAGVQVVGILTAVLGLGTLNRVLYRLALVPLKDYVFFLAQAQNVGYIIIYYTLLFMRYQQGKVTDAMLATPKALFILTGMCEAVAQLLMMTGAAHLPGALLPLLMQTVLLWNLLFSHLVFRTRPTVVQVLGVLAVLAGVVVASWPSGGSGSVAAADIEPVYLALCIVSFAFPALATITKEHIFKEAAKSLGGGQQLDVLVVNAFCSTAQAVFLLFLLPLSCQLKGLSLADLPAYLKAGTACLLGDMAGCGTDCSGAPLLPALYVAVNIGFNVAAMYLVRSLGAVATALTMSCLVPITVLAFTLPLPYLPPAHLGTGFVLGTVLLMLGLVMFNARMLLPYAVQWRQRWQQRWQQSKLADG